MTIRSSDFGASGPARPRRHHDQFFVVPAVVIATLAFVVVVGLLGWLALHSSLH